eukprot:tig00021043_g17624.t1
MIAEAGRYEEKIVASFCALNNLDAVQMNGSPAGERTLARLGALPAPSGGKKGALPAIQPLFEVAVNMAMEAGADLSAAVHRAASDFGFVLSAIEPEARSDEFLAQLLKVYRVAYERESPQPLALAVLRHDFMLEAGGGAPELKLVQQSPWEATSTSGVLGGLVARLHAYLALRAYPQASRGRGGGGGGGGGGEVEGRTQQAHPARLLLRSPIP